MSKKQGEQPQRDPLALLAEKAFKEGRAAGINVADCADIIAGLIRDMLEQRGSDDAEMNKEMISVQSIFGARTGHPLVDFKVGLEHFTLSVDAARDHAYGILDACNAAVTDAAVFRWLTLEMGMDVRVAGDAIGDLRRFRGDIPKADWRTPEQMMNDKRQP